MNKKILLCVLLVIGLIGINFSVQAQNLLSKANKQYELHAYNFAIANYLKVIQKDPNEPQALARIADCYRLMNDMETAAHWYSKAVNFAGIDPVHFLNYGKTLMFLGDYDKAKIWFKTYAESDPAVGTHYVKSCDFAMAQHGKPSTFRVFKEFLNTANSDFGPAFFGDYIVYSSSRTDIKRAKKQNQSKGFSESPNNQLYITSRDNKGYLRKPTLWQSDLQNNYNEGPVTFSKDNKQVVFTKNVFESGIRQVPEAGSTLSMYIADVDNNGVWSNIKPLPFNVNGYSAGYPSFSNDGKLLYFSSNREGGFGGWDIYVSFRTAAGWSSPQNLGPVINTPGDEISPFLENPTTLYFSSDYHHGLGGMDIYRAHKTQGAWSEVYHLGNHVNSTYDDYGYIFDGTENRGYFVSNRNKGKGNEDLYQVRKMTDEFVITVLNESSLQPIEGAIVDFSACGEPSFETNINGKYEFEALAGLGCDVIVRKEGYKPYAFKLESLGDRLTRSVEVKLRKMGDEFVGKIVDSESNESISEVVIKATNNRTGLTSRTTSNQWGEYTLAMEAPDEYTVSYSKAGYMNTKKKIKISSKTDKGVLGVLAYSKSYSIGGSGIVESNPDHVPEDLPTGFDDEMKSKGYSVQVAAYFDNREINVGTYQSLQEIGNVYKMKEKKAEKVRVGIYETRKEAEEARKQIVKKGYAKAFVVQEEGRQSRQLAVKAEPQYEERAKSIIEEPNIDIKVRVATFRSTKNFDVSEMKTLGEVEMKAAGNFTIVLLKGFKSLEEARRVQNKVVSLGYKDAHLVREQGKLFKKVE